MLEALQVVGDGHDGPVEVGAVAIGEVSIAKRCRFSFLIILTFYFTYCYSIARFIIMIYTCYLGIDWPSRSHSVYNPI